MNHNIMPIKQGSKSRKAKCGFRNHWIKRKRVTSHPRFTDI